MRRLLALMLGVAVASGMIGSGLAHGQTTVPRAEKPTGQNVNGTVKSAAADTLVVAGKNKGTDAEWAFVVGPGTKIRKAGKDITGADLATGDLVHVRYHAEGGKNVADAVMARAPKKAAGAPRK